MAKKNKTGWYSFVRWYPADWYMETRAMDALTLCAYMRLAAQARNNDGRPGTYTTTLAMMQSAADIPLKAVWQALCRMTKFVSAGAPLCRLEISGDGRNYQEIDRREADVKEKETPDAFAMVRVCFAWIEREETEARKARKTESERVKQYQKRRKEEGEKTADNTEREVITRNSETSSVITELTAKSKSKSKSKSKKRSTATSAVQEPLELKGDISREPIRWDKESQSITGVGETDLKRWSTAYPLVNVEAEKSKAELWLKENPRRMKKDLVRFLGAWLRRTQEDAENRGQRTEDGGQRTGPTRFARGASDQGETGQKIEKNPSAGGMGQLLSV